VQATLRSLWFSGEITNEFRTMKRWLYFYIFSLFALVLSAETNVQTFYKRLSLPDLSSYSDETVLKVEEWLNRLPQKLQADLPVIIQGLNDSDVEVRRAATGLSYSIGIALTYNAPANNKAKLMDQIVPALIERLKDNDAKVKENAALAISLVDPPPSKAREPMLSLLKDPNNQIKKIALSALSRMRPVTPDVTNAILTVLTENPALKIEAVESLGQLEIGDKAVIVALQGALSDNSEYSRKSALIALMKIGSAAIEAAPAVAEKAKSSSESELVRITAINTMYTIAGDSELVVSTIVELLRDPNSDIKMKALNITEKLGQAARPVIAELDRIAHDPKEESTLREKASSVLQQLQGKN
jgi:HEAT repeat protein